MNKQPIYGPNQRLLNISALSKHYDELISPQYQVSILKNALLTPTNHIFVKSRYIPTGLYTTNDDKKLSIIRQVYFYLKFDLLSSIERHYGTFFLAHDAWSDNYYHWLCEVLPRLLLMGRQYTGGTVILPRRLSQFSYITDSLQIIDLKVLWIENSKSYRFSNLITVLTTPAYATVNYKLQTDLKDSILKHLNIPQLAAKRKVFISRAKASRRNIVNEADIRELVIRNGYEIIFCEDMSFAEQVRLFAETVSLISLHGAGLTNIMFMPKDSKVLEIRDQNWNTNPLCYWWLSNVLELKWNYHLGNSKGEGSNFKNITINVEKFTTDFADFEDL